MPIEETIDSIKVTSPLFICDDHVHTVYLFKDSVYRFDEASLASKKYFLAGVFKRQLEILAEKGKFIETVIWKAYSDSADKDAICMELNGHLKGNDILSMTSKHMGNINNTTISCECDDHE